MIDKADQVHPVENLVSDSEQAEVVFTIPLTFGEDASHVAYVNVFKNNPNPGRAKGTALFSIEVEGSIQVNETLADFLADDFTLVSRIVVKFVFHTEWYRETSKQEIRRALRIALTAIDRAEFRIVVDVLKQCLATNATEQSQRKEAYDFVKEQLVKEGEAMWKECEMAGLGRAKVTLDEKAVWGYGRRVEIISWLHNLESTDT